MPNGVAEPPVCLAGAEGSFPLRSHVLREGIRFPLGVASAGPASSPASTATARPRWAPLLLEAAHALTQRIARLG
jgi:hypothetical protein